MSGAPSFTTAELADRVRGELCGRDDLTVTGVNALDDASTGDITFLADEAHAARWSAASAVAAVVSRDLQPAGHDPDSRALIRVPDAALAMIELLQVFAPAPPLPDVGTHPTAWVHPDATLGRDVRIGPHVSIDRGTTVGHRVVLHAGTRLYPNVSIGDESVVHANTVIRQRCRIGRRVVLHENVSIGADGFGYEAAPDGSGVLKVPQIGTVEIEDDVEIGAGSCVDRAKFGVTVIGAGTKIDNLVQIGHNCRIGRHCVIVALSGLAGSVTLEDGVTLAGAVGVADHVTIGRGATVGAQSGVMRDIPPGKTYLGTPAVEARQFFRQFAALGQLPDWMRRVSRRLGEDLK